jgi:hypothetical protein
MNNARIGEKFITVALGALALATLLLGATTHPAAAVEGSNGELVFIVAADMRNFSAQG